MNRNVLADLLQSLNVTYAEPTQNRWTPPWMLVQPNTRNKQDAWPLLQQSVIGGKGDMAPAAPAGNGNILMMWLNQLAQRNGRG